MAPNPVWTGNLRLSLVIIPVKLYPAVSPAERVSFRMTHEASGQPIRNVKGIPTPDGFQEVPDDEIVKGYEHIKGEHVLIRQEEIDDLKLEAKHTIDLARFVDAADVDARWFEKPYYILPEGDVADEGYTVLRDALVHTGKIAIGQVVMSGREHLVCIGPFGKGLMLFIIRYRDELRDEQPYFEKIKATAEPEAVKLAVQVVEGQAGKFEPDAMSCPYVAAVREMVQAKIEQREPAVEITSGRSSSAPAVVDIMAALKESIQAKGRAKLSDAVRKRTKGTEQSRVTPAKTPHRPSARSSLN